jgi:hypothetical protein
MDVTNAVCSACQRAIDPHAKLCPFCGANPATGEKDVETQQILNEVFHPKEVTASESVIEYARHRQGIVISIAIVVAFLALAGLHQFVTLRNAREVTDAPPVPLTEVTDQNGAVAKRAPAMPDLQFQYDGRPQAMRTFIVEQGALTPPEVVAAQQAAAQEAAAAAAAKTPAPATPQLLGAPFRPPAAPGSLPATRPVQ